MDNLIGRDNIAKRIIFYAIYNAMIRLVSGENILGPSKTLYMQAPKAPCSNTILPEGLLVFLLGRGYGYA